ncbi:unnamed protein product [Fraxinus pennsylvanica]|uniref:Uncharacterized protein n=1 Tax=Fraxinus pennsylvanica TaxID=56036 RepID=A0AAD1YZS3_9LAMI|nr:unnamed protein product [Fraxinus pennsylvanica]
MKAVAEDEELDSLYSLSSLEQLSVSANDFSGQLSDKLRNSTQLEQFTSHSNSFSGALPSTLALCTKLQVLDLQNNTFSGAIDLDFTGLPNLYNLDLASNRFSSPLPESLSSCQKLRILSLAKNNLTVQIPKGYANLTSLTFLSFSNNSLVNLSGGSIPSQIGQMENLYYLDFSNNSLTGEIRKGLTELKSLMSANSCSSTLNITTGIPLFVKRNQSASGLQYNQASSFPPSILLSNNKLNGSIWPEIGRLRQLHVLDLSRNNITGTIPNSVSNITNLETLDLSYNDLHGSIPSSFNQLTFLSKFSVANNHLEGAIPTGGQFLSFPSSSFDGNPGLCGKMISPCITNNMGFRASSPPTAYKKFDWSSILGITISIGIGIALLLAILLLRISRRDAGVPIEDLDEEISRPPRLFDAFGPPTLLIFKNEECTDLTILDLLKSTNNFNQSNIIDCGGFGLVYKAD